MSKRLTLDGLSAAVLRFHVEKTNTFDIHQIEFLQIQRDRAYMTR
jgi:hypothetical protein